MERILSIVMTIKDTINGRQMEGVRGFLNSLRFGTRFLLIFMIFLYILQFAVLDRNATGYLSFCPKLIIERGQVWRLITGTYLHGGVLHLLMNMMSFSFLGISLESAIGTLSYFYHIIVFGIISGLVHVLIAYFMWLGGDSSEVYGHAVGFSGVLFALIVIDIDLSGGDQRSVLGLFLVPCWAYPWVMLMLMSLLMPNVSFFGHLAGMVTGYLYKFKILSIIAPSTQTLASIERRMSGCCTDRVGYVNANGQRDGNYQPYAVFQHAFRDTPSDDVPARPAGFTGTGRVIGDDAGGDHSGETPGNGHL
jgi:membrane associated rhomboid family serine protease